MSRPTRRTTARRRGLAAIGAVGAFALLAACSSGPTETTAPEETVAVDPFAPEVTDVKLAGIKAPGLIPLHIAATETSAEYGLTIEPVWIDNSGIAITPVISQVMGSTLRPIGSLPSPTPPGAEQVIGEPSPPVIVEAP